MRNPIQIKSIFNSRRDATDDSQLGANKSGASESQIERSISGNDPRFDVGGGMANGANRTLGSESSHSRAFEYEKKINQQLRAELETSRNVSRFNRRFFWLVLVPILALAYFVLR